MRQLVRKSLALLLAAVMAVSLLPTVAFSYTEPEQNADGVYQIGTADELFWFADTINSGGDDSLNAELTADIDLKDADWTPISS